MSEITNVTICFFVALVVFCYVLPKIRRIFLELNKEYSIFLRMKKVTAIAGGDLYETSADEDETPESIGLSQKNTDLGNNPLVNYIVRFNPKIIDEMKNLLLKAGIRQQNALDEFMKSKVHSGIALFLILLLLFATNDWGIPILESFLLAIVCGMYGGHLLTNINLELLAEKRKKAIEHGVPDLVDLLVICTESGLDLNGSIKRIARELRTSNPTLADEMSLTAIEMEMIPDSRQVFTNLENRTDSLQIKTLSKTLSQSIEYGSSLSASLRELAIESRQTRMLNAEAAAAKAPTLLTLPMMFFIMPCLFIVMLGPVIVGMIRSFRGGA